jgi:molecular chaperone HtpG
VRGVIDSEDLPLNISREMLQNNPQVAQIRKAVSGRLFVPAREQGIDFTGETLDRVVTLPQLGHHRSLRRKERDT